MKNYTLLFNLLLCFFIQQFVIAQDNKDLNISSNNIELLNQVLKQDSLRTFRIESFFEKSNLPQIVDRDNRIFSVYDIIDNQAIYITNTNLDASRATKTDHLQIGGSLGLDLDGSTMTVGVWDGGPVFNTHSEFLNSGGSSRVNNNDTTVVDGDTGFSDHGTHVAGTVGANGTNPNAKGMATNISIESYNWINDTSEMLLEASDIFNPMLLSNHSYGAPVQSPDGNIIPNWIMGAYTQDAATLDEILYNNPFYLPVFSAGNDGQTSYSGGLLNGFDKLTLDKLSKNNLVVANANPSVNSSGDITSLVINPNSSRGPSDDLRIKPDISGDGTNVFSPIAGTNSYDTYSGTSMSAPNVTGSLALLQEYYFQLNNQYMRSSTVKGLVCHTAYTHNTMQAVPNPTFGWGFLDAEASAVLIEESTTNESIIAELSLTQNTTYTYDFNVSNNEPIRASICWTDPKGTPVNNVLNSSTPTLVNDLDIRIIKSDGTVYLPWKLELSIFTGFSPVKADNSVDNIERIDINNPETGSYQLVVTHKGTLSNINQDFSLILSGEGITLSLNENILSKSLKLYPNPSSNATFTIEFNNSYLEDVNVDVYDVSGRLIFNRLYSNSTPSFNKTIELSDSSSGVYFVKISSGKNIITKKLILN